MTFREALAYGEKKLNEAGIIEAKNDSWLLLAMACHIDHTFYYMHMEEELEVDQWGEFETLIRKRAERIPLQYITGEQEFMGILFHVNSSVLIPRQDTETLVEEALKVVRPGMKVLDLCTGSGCIIISIMKNATGVEGFGYDISKQALLVAKENAKENGVSVTFERSDLFDNITETFDVIVSNPPYIKTAEIATLMPEVAQFEPVTALDGMEDGLHFYRKIVEECTEYLNEDGYLIFEIGCDQGQQVADMLRQAGFSEIRIIKDLAQNDRVVMGHLL